MSYQGKPVTRKSIPHIHYTLLPITPRRMRYALPAYRRCIGPAGSIDLTETAHRMSGWVANVERLLLVGTRLLIRAQRRFKLARGAPNCQVRFAILLVRDPGRNGRHR
jgi:hypothetical protein